MDKQELYDAIKERVSNKTWLFHGGMGLVITDIEEGFVKGEVAIEERHLNPIGTVHGSLYMAMGDTLGGSSFVTTGIMVTTVSSHMEFLSAPSGEAKKIIGKAQVVKRGRTIGVTQIDISDDTGRHLATGLYEFMKLSEYP